MAASFQDIQVFGLQNRPVSDRTKRPWIVRWAVSLRRHSKSFRTRTEAEGYRSLLTHAQTLGEPFDEVTGEPLSWRPSPDDVQVHIWARRWLAEEWPEWAPRTRVSAVEAIARFVPLLLAADAPGAAHRPARVT